MANGVVVNGNDPGLGIAVDTAGHSYVTGVFSGTIQLGNRTLTSHGESEALVTKCDPNVVFAWSVSMGAAGWDLGVAIAVDAAGDIYGTGQFRGQVPVGSITVTSQYSSKAFVGKLSLLGVFLWVARGGGHSAQGFAHQTGTELISLENVELTFRPDGRRPGPTMIACPPRWQSSASRFVRRGKFCRNTSWRHPRPG